MYRRVRTRVYEHANMVGGAVPDVSRRTCSTSRRGTAESIMLVFGRSIPMRGLDEPKGISRSSGKLRLEELVYTGMGR